MRGTALPPGRIRPCPYNRRMKLSGALAGAFLVSSLAAAQTSPAPAPAEGTRPYLAPWVVLGTGTAGFDGWGALTHLSPAKASPNSPGLLFEVPAGSGRPITAAFDPEAGRWASLLTSSAHAAGLRAGIAVSLPDVAVPTDPRAAEAATIASLFPDGPGVAFFAAKDADLFELHFPDLANLPARSFVLKKVASELRAQSPSAAIAVTFAAGPDGLFPADAAGLLAN